MLDRFRGLSWAASKPAPAWGSPPARNPGRREALLVTQAHLPDREDEPETLLTKLDVRAESGRYIYSLYMHCHRAAPCCLAPLQARLTALTPAAWVLESNRCRIEAWLCHGSSVASGRVSTSLCLLVLLGRVRKRWCLLSWPTCRSRKVVHGNIAALIPTFSPGQEPSCALSHLLLKSQVM